jgi:hypothetical protein
MSHRSLLVAWLALALASLASPAAAQQASDESAARALFEQANDAADHHDYARAESLFEESLEIAPRPATAFNLAEVQRARGAMRAAERRVLELIDGRYGALPASLREPTAQLLAEIRARIATLEVALDGASEATMRIDGGDPVVLRSDAPARSRVDPGRHRLLARTDDGRSIERELRLAAGSTESITLSFEPIALEGEEEGGPSLEWLAWTAAIVVVIGAGVGIAVGVATAQPSRETILDPVWGMATALRIP